MSKTKDELEKHIAELEAEIEQVTRLTYCLFCGKEFPLDGDGSDVSAHIQECEKHPLFTANERIAELEAENAGLELMMAEGEEFDMCDDCEYKKRCVEFDAEKVE